MARLRNERSRRLYLALVVDVAAAVVLVVLLFG
jgi:hypothetical protein